MRSLCFMVLLGCGQAPPPEPQPGCNPLVGDDCLSPFPSQFFQGEAGVQIAAGILPVQVNGLPISPARLNGQSGFSPATPFFVYFKAGVDPANLPAPEMSVTAQSAVQLLRLEDGTRLPVMAELDANAFPGERQALIVRPLTRLSPGQRYLIALVGLKDRAGQPLSPAPFRALRDRTALSSALRPLEARYEQLFAELARAGVPRGSLTLAWEVTIGGDATAHLLAMRDQAFGLALGHTITGSRETPNDPYLLRQVTATVQVPLYLDESESFLQLDSDGKPQMQRLTDVPVVINIPQCSKSNGPLPLVVFGHGIFLNAADTLSYSANQRLAQSWCTVWAATDWLGLTTADIAGIANSISADLNNVYRVQDRLQQAMVNHLVMTKLLRGALGGDPALQVDGHASIDPARVHYFGISNGGIQGAGLMALTPDITRGVLNVPGANWSLLIWRSTDFNGLKPLLTSALPDPFDAQLFIGLLQSEWDHVDPGTFAPHLLGDPLAGSMTKQILVQESIGDAQVSNLATRYLARAMGIPGLAPLSEPVYGVSTQPAPLESAYTQWNSHSLPLPPATNTSLKEDTAAHNAVWSNEKAQQQIGVFFETGQVVDVCGGPCDI